MSFSFQINYHDLDAAITKLAPILEFEPLELMESAAALGESQTRRRITDEKTAPDGTPWLPNLEGTSILQRTGRNLLDSVASVASADEAEWGASWEHAHVHQEGMVIEPKNGDRLYFSIGGKMAAAKKVTIPARPFVGMSEENWAELLELVTDVFSVGGQP